MTKALPRVQHRKLVRDLYRPIGATLRRPVRNVPESGKTALVGPNRPVRDLESMRTEPSTWSPFVLRTVPGND